MIPTTLFLLLCGVAPAAAETPGDLRVVLDWDGEGPSLVPLEEIERICTSLLARPEELSQDVLAEVYLRRADARYYLGKRAQAAEDLERVLEMRPGDIQARWRLASAWLGCEGARSKALTLANELIAEKPDFPRGYEVAGAYYFEAGSFDLAIERFTKAIERDDGLVGAYVGRAFAYYKKRKFKRCLQDVRRALLLGRTPIDRRPSLLSLEGAALTELGRVEDAEPRLLRAREMDPTLPGVNVALWVCFSQRGKFGWCLRLSREMVERDPGDAPAHWVYARSLAQAGRLLESLPVAEKAVELQPTSSSAWGALGCVYAGLGNYGQALGAYRESVLHGPGNVDSAVRLAFLLATCPDALFRNGQTARGIAELCPSALKTPQHRRSAMLVLAMAQAECGDTEKAAQTAAKALKIGDLDPATRERYGKLVELFQNGSAYRHDPKRPEQHLFDLPPAVAISDRYSVWGQPVEDGELEEDTKSETQAPAAPQTPSELPLVLDWDGEGPSLLPLGEMEGICTSLLAASAELSEEVLAEVYLRRADARHYLGKRAESVEDLERVLEMRPGDIRARWRLARAWVTCEGTRSKVLTLANELITEKPDSARGYLWAGAYYVFAGSFQLAIESFTKAIERDERLAGAYLGRAVAYCERAEFERCLQDVRRGLLLAPRAKDPYAYLLRLEGLALTKLERVEDAERRLLIARMMAPTLPGLSEALWICFANRGKFGWCVRLSREMAEHNPGDVQARLLYALSLAQVGRPVDALPVAEKAVELERKNSLAWGTLGCVHAALGNYGEAVRAYRESLLHGPGNRDTALRLAFLLATCPDARFRAGHTASGISEKCASALKTPEHRRSAMLVLAMAQAECGDTDKAAQTAAEAVKIGDLDPATRERYGKLIDLFQNGSPYRHDPKRPDQNLFDLPPAVRITDSYSVRGQPVEGDELEDDTKSESQAPEGLEPIQKLISP